VLLGVNSLSLVVVLEILIIDNRNSFLVHFSIHIARIYIIAQDLIHILN
jgi:hypothetical protein